MTTFPGRIVALMALIAVAGFGSSAVRAQAAPYVEGKHFTRLAPAVPVSTPAGVVEVVEVFSYGCPACWQASTFVQKLKKALPAGKTQFVYVPASWNPSEAWPMFQRAYITANSMGIADKVHDQVFDAVWRSGEIPLVDPATNRLRPQKPTIEDAAKFYARTTGVKAEDFVAASKSFAVETKIGQAEKLVRAYRAESTPTFVVAGKYRVESRSAAGYDDIMNIVRYLVERELAGAK